MADSENSIASATAAAAAPESAIITAENHRILDRDTDVDSNSTHPHDELQKLCNKLEQSRVLEEQLEAWMHMASHLIRYDDPNHDNDGLAAAAEHAVPAVWNVFCQHAAPPPPLSLEQNVNVTTTNISVTTSTTDNTLPQGPRATAARKRSLAYCLQQSSQTAADIQVQRQQEHENLKQLNHSTVTSESVLLSFLDARVQEIQSYYAVKRNKVEAATAAPTGTALVASSLSSELQSFFENAEEEEVYGKYLDLKQIHAVQSKSFLPNAVYSDFLTVLSQGLYRLDENTKWEQPHGKAKYFKFLQSLYDYLVSFLKRTQPLQNIKAIVQPTLDEFQETWSNTGGYKTWKAIEKEAVLAKQEADKNDSDNATTTPLIDLGQFQSAQELSQTVDANTLKMELMRLGLKCGGTPLQRAERFFLTKTTPLSELPEKLFAKKNQAPCTRMAVAKLEAMVDTLLDTVRPELEATMHREVRRQTQTLQEQEQEWHDEVYGALEESSKGKDQNAAGNDDDDDDDDAPMYNPKNVPLDWDGKPIPYWLFKLHGLNHYYPCEICGGEAYRGRRAFELHFAETKHAANMKRLGIPNTKHFHGVTTIEDARALWKQLQEQIIQDQELHEIEEYEDSHGNVLNRKAYEDLARSGML